MLPDENSPLRRLPEAIPPEQRISLDGIRYAIEMADIAYRRLAQNLEHIDLTSGEIRKEFTHASYFLDAWSVVDCLHRLKGLLLQTRRLEHSPDLRWVVKQFDDAEELRNIVQHLNSAIPELLRLNQPVMGTLAWIRTIDQSNLLSCCMIPGSVRKMTGHLINPLGMVIRAPIDQVSLSLKEITLNLSEKHGTLVRFTGWLENALKDAISVQIESSNTAAGDITFAMKIAARSSPVGTPELPAS